ncbi:hypothetical protein SAMD00019534_116840 [Acytostelium subglobosum LB1]|uniref:hypothetical protein n=1 Tax=Acytostelium subglobosum LB1 TaxID=1410327 RepID=UPI0006448205|nr:hypothetical protein SAMD00019534_116840 [Acytostelium subglobosum LB1]GAM28508.1 hypothetical protein SAMD00019534_116840 [Acytostelium subglobosum LB1]|eukprot:XP_012748547.1 hypothetical protein SAMD00019534_116840 [Acytostelium subglobosum LB1]
MDAIISQLNLTSQDLLGLQISGLAYVVFLITHFLKPRLAFQFSCLILAVCAGLTQGFTFGGVSNTFADMTQEQLYDSGFASLLLIITLIALYNNAKTPLILGYILHGGWDYLHHHSSSIHMAAATPLWYPLFCCSYDLAVALTYVFVRYPSSSESRSKSKTH